MYLDAGSQHDALGDEVGLGLDVDVVPLQSHQQHAEVGAAQIQSQKVPLLCT